jgi:pimeloyl-ACP methyl ester carboxylesterase
MDLLTVAKPYLNSDMLRVERAGFRLLCLIPAATVRVTSHITRERICPQTSLATSSQFLMLLGSKKALYWGYSQGGWIAFALAQHAVGRIAGFLIGGAAGGGQPIKRGRGC